MDQRLIFKLKLHRKVVRLFILDDVEFNPHCSLRYGLLLSGFAELYEISKSVRDG
jgi:hypothetical protein